jgi:hypothetical protein
MGVGCALNEAVRLGVKDVDYEQRQLMAKALKIGSLFFLKAFSSS